MKALTATLLISTAVLWTGFATPANSAEQKDATSNHSEPITTIDYADGSGFEVRGGGALFTYIYKTKVLTMTSEAMHLESAFPSPEKD